MLADFVLHKMFSSSEFDGIVAVELGAGVGKVDYACVLKCFFPYAVMLF